jgi:hypothetical protein
MELKKKISPGIILRFKNQRSVIYRRMKSHNFIVRPAGVVEDGEAEVDEHQRDDRTQSPPLPFLHIRAHANDDDHNRPPRPSTEGG